MQEEGNPVQQVNNKPTVYLGGPITHVVNGCRSNEQHGRLFRNIVRLLSTDMCVRSAHIAEDFGRHVSSPLSTALRDLEWIGRRRPQPFRYPLSPVPLMCPPFLKLAPHTFERRRQLLLAHRSPPLLVNKVRERGCAPHARLPKGHAKSHIVRLPLHPAQSGVLIWPTERDLKN